MPQTAWVTFGYTGNCAKIVDSHDIWTSQYRRPDSWKLRLSLARVNQIFNFLGFWTQPAPSDSTTNFHNCCHHRRCTLSSRNQADRFLIRLSFNSFSYSIPVLVSLFFYDCRFHSFTISLNVQSPLSLHSTRSLVHSTRYPLKQTAPYCSHSSQIHSITFISLHVLHSLASPMFLSIPTHTKSSSYKSPTTITSQKILQHTT